MERLTWCEHLLGKLPARSDLAELFSPLSTLFYNTITSASAQVVALEVEKYPVQDHDQAAISPEDKCQDQSPAPAPDQALVPALAEADQGMRFEQMSYTFSTISALGLESILPLLASTSFDAEILRGAKARPSQPTRALSTLI
ncbi:MAG: hypothetical protein AUG89_06140 [Acidobacteria bacterium 13_1_20CM_4_56_7]|nr:MAG: hypothetical protein AUG89_06140 [Acidobacteria bacterium 13_1_20CM_4_56_7]